MLKRGLQNKQIAYELKISETTVKVHVSDILRKLNVLSRTKAIVEMSRIDFATPGCRGQRDKARASPAGSAVTRFSAVWPDRCCGHSLDEFY